MTYIFSSYVTQYILSQQLLLRPYTTATTLSQWPIFNDLYPQHLRHYELYCRNHSYATKALYYTNYYVSMTQIYSSYVTIIHTSQQLLLRPYITATNISTWSTFSALTSLWAILSQQLLRHWGPISQQSPCLYDLYLQLLRYNDTYGWPISTALTLQWFYCLTNQYSGPMLLQLLCLHDPYLQLLRH